MNRATESHVVSMTQTRIQRFPQSLRGIGGGEGNRRYVVPSVVAIGPFHHGRAHLHEMEEVKLMAAHRFCADSGVQVVRDKIFSIAGDARRCYAATGDLQIAALEDAEFAEMMFVDGCFLLQFMFKGNEPPIVGRFLSSGPSILKDIFLLENQIPWLVLEALAKYVPMHDGLVIADLVLNFIVDHMKGYFFLDRSRKEDKARLCFQNLLAKCRCAKDPVGMGRSFSHGDHPNPKHLLGLLRFGMTRGMPSQKRRSELSNRSFPRLSCSAVDLAQIGVKLTASRTPWFADVNCQKKPIFGELSLSPLFLNHVAACCLVNLAALEVTEATSASSSESDGFVVSSYLSVLAMLMDSEEDVHQLRVRGVLCSNFSNNQTLAFFKELVQYLRLGYNYYAAMEEIDEYMRRRPVRIAVHRFIYNNYRTIVAVLSIASVLVGIFKALKKP
ncbi:hypothetical protein SETIT_6G081300v2 [Setaria italica]|uniref:Uncharacterized protein n=2 Tax=Setaria italica TaxID=4555 RepID=A0A368RJN4_SETIT|nr:hypothetical protein SETIT_6G081300v2 [Setaria italica]